jgi:hypothetical protein
MSIREDQNSEFCDRFRQLEREAIKAGRDIKNFVRCHVCFCKIIPYGNATKREELATFKGKRFFHQECAENLTTLFSDEVEPLPKGRTVKHKGKEFVEMRVKSSKESR